MLDLPPAPQATEVPVLQTRWWLAFQDPVLDAWVQEALARNRDLSTAATHVAEARAALAASVALDSPRLDAQAGLAMHQRRFGLSGVAADFQTRNQTASAGLALSWEWDLWGRLAQMNEAARARLEASSLTQEAMALSVASLVTDSYFQWRTLQDKLHIAQDAQRHLESVTQLERRRWQAGLGTERAYRQSLAELAAVQSHIPPLEMALGQTALALQSLAGRSPRELNVALPPSQGQPTLPALPDSVDSRLLLRRPDVAAAELALQAAHADWNVSLAQRYPRVSLFGLGGLLASTSGAIAGLPAWFEAGGAVTAPILDAGLLDAQAQAAQVRRERAALQYQQAVAHAYRELHEAVLQHGSSDRHAASVHHELLLRQQALAFSQRSYQAGRSTQYEVLSETVKVLQVQWTLADAQLSQWLSRSHFYKALGGGV